MTHSERIELLAKALCRAKHGNENMMSETRQGAIIMSCGCRETPELQGSVVSYGTHDTFDDGSYGPCIASAYMCKPCAEKLARHGAPFFDREEQAVKWLRAMQ